LVNGKSDRILPSILPIILKLSSFLSSHTAWNSSWYLTPEDVYISKVFDDSKRQSKSL
jgi:hypothetical protein